MIHELNGVARHHDSHETQSYDNTRHRPIPNKPPRHVTVPTIGCRNPRYSSWAWRREEGEGHVCCLLLPCRRDFSCREFQSSFRSRHDDYDDDDDVDDSGVITVVMR